MQLRQGLLLAIPLLAASCATEQETLRTAPSEATYITRAEIERVNASPGVDRNIRVIDIGHENFAVGIVRRGRTVNGVAIDRPPGGSGAQPDGACGETREDTPPDGVAGGITHDAQTEGYLILSGRGTMFTGGRLVNGRHFALAELNGPTCIGTAYGVTVAAVEEGDVIIIPAGVVHGWSDVADHVSYLTFRPSPDILEAGWTHPALREEIEAH